MTVLCDSSGCGEPCGSIGELAAHRIREHDSLPSEALRRARTQFGVTTERPARMDFAPTPAPAQRLRPPRQPRRTGKPHAANPAACRYCTRMAPEKCARHGGPSHSTSFRGDRSDPVAYRAWADAMRIKVREAKRTQRARRRGVYGSAAMAVSS